MSDPESAPAPEPAPAPTEPLHSHWKCGIDYAPEGERGIALAKAVAKLLLQREGAAPLEWEELARRLHPWNMNPRDCTGFRGQLEAHVAIMHQMQEKPGWQKAFSALTGEPIP